MGSIVSPLPELGGVFPELEARIVPAVESTGVEMAPSAGGGTEEEADDMSASSAGDWRAGGDFFGLTFRVGGRGPEKRGCLLRRVGVDEEGV